MNPIRATKNQQLALDRYLGEILIHGGLAELVPLKQRGTFPARLGLAILLLSLIGWLGLPWSAAVLCLILAFAFEMLNYYWRRRGSAYSALVSRSLWARIRPSFYWSLAGSAVLATWLYAGATLFEGLLRGSYEWVCFWIIADLVQHPERYGSAHQFSNWLAHLRREIGHAFQAWVKYAIFGTLLALVLNMSSGQIWDSVGHTAWTRLSIFGGGLYLLALLTFRSLSRSTVRSAVQQAMEGWEGIRPSDLKRVLRSIPAIPGVFYTGSRSAELVEERLQWKNEDNLVARVGQQLLATLVQRYQWNAWISSSLTLILVALFIALSAFLLVPREVMIRWMSTGTAGELGPVLALDSLTGSGAEAFWKRLSELDAATLADEPLPKLAFLEALIIVSLIMFETSSGQLKADLDPSHVRRWLTLGTTYLALLENEFQYLYGGFITRRLAGVGTLRFVSIRNDILLVPSAQRRLGVFKAIADFLRVYELPEWSAYPSAIAIFDSYPVAQKWALKFLRFSPLVMDRPHDLEQAAFWEADTVPERYWIWSGNRLILLSSLEEARWYARLVALYNNHSNGGKGHGPS
jgi:hypothetical protein